MKRCPGSPHWHSQAEEMIRALLLLLPQGTEEEERRRGGGKGILVEAVLYGSGVPVLRLGAHHMVIAEYLHIINFESGMESLLHDTALMLLLSAGAAMACQRHLPFNTMG